jgi:signal transduction histidine kinase
MPGLLGYARAATAGLAAFVAILLFLRFRVWAPNRGRSLFVIVLGLACVRTLVPWRSSIAGLFGFALLWALGLQAAVHSGRRQRAGGWLWHAWCAAGAASVAAAVLVGYWDTVPSRLLFGFAFVPLSVLVSFRQMATLGRSAGGLPRDGAAGSEWAVWGVAVVVLMAATGLEVLLPRSEAAKMVGVSATFALLAVCGCSLNAGALSRELGEACGPERLQRVAPEIRAARVRLAENESSLLAIDRLVALSLVSAGAVHELKGSLAGILSSAEYALRWNPESRIREALERILVHARQGGISGTRYLEHIARCGREEVRPVDLGRDLAELLHLLRGTCRQRGVGFSFHLDPGIVVQIRAGELAQVLLSLVRNALDGLESAAGTVDSPRLEIRARCWDGEAILEIVDNGPGIAVAQVGSLFERAASGKDSTGLGLYLSRMLVERNGGALEYVPTENGGCFRLSLPLVERR